MFIQIKGLKDEKLVRPVQLIAGLFFEETVITEKTSDAVMLFTMTDTKAILKLTIFGQVYKASEKSASCLLKKKSAAKLSKMLSRILCSMCLHNIQALRKIGAY